MKYKPERRVEIIIKKTKSTLSLQLELGTKIFSLQHPTMPSIAQGSLQKEVWLTPQLVQTGSVAWQKRETAGEPSIMKWEI